MTDQWAPFEEDDEAWMDDPRWSPDGRALVAGYPDAEPLQCDSPECPHPAFYQLPGHARIQLCTEHIVGRRGGAVPIHTLEREARDRCTCGHVRADHTNRCRFYGYGRVGDDDPCRCLHFVSAADYFAPDPDGEDMSGVILDDADDVEPER